MSAFWRGKGFKGIRLKAQLTKVVDMDDAVISGVDDVVIEWMSSRVESLSRRGGV